MLFRTFAAALSLSFCLALSLVTPARAALAEELSEVNRLHHAGQTDVALARADRYLATQPKDAQMRFLKALLLADSGKGDDAQLLLEQLAQDYPELPEPHNNLAALAAARGDYGTARGELEEAVRLNPSFAPARENLGDVLVMLAAQSYARALRLEPDSRSLPGKIALVRQVAVPVEQALPAAAAASEVAPAAPRPARKKSK